MTDTDLTHGHDHELERFAALAFWRGIYDARQRKTPRSANELLLFLPPANMTILHKLKLRQVYGAAFDITKAKLSAPAGSGAPDV